MKYEPNQRVAFYEVTGFSQPCPATNVEMGSILIDRPRGEVTTWEFISGAWISGKRLGFARVDPETLKPVPEPKLQAILDERKEKLDAEAQ